MVKINNLAVIQKLVDELKLYPGTDVIPTELAEKILPCFVINSQEINMKVEPCDVVRNVAGQTADYTLYTTPANGRFFLCNADIDAWGTNDLTYDAFTYIQFTPKGDVAARGILNLGFDAGDTDEGARKNNSASFNNPIELEPGSNIVLKATSNGNLKVGGSIAGYTAD